MKIPYFDAHCDTIYRCEENGCVLAQLWRWRQTRRSSRLTMLPAAVCGKTVDTLTWCEDRDFARYGQFFALYWDAKNAPAGGMFAQCQRLHKRFLRKWMKTGTALPIAAQARR